MKTYCGADCGACDFKENCPGCETTFGSPFGGKCIAAETVKAKGADAYREYKEQLKAEVNELLRMLGMPEAETLSELVGAFVNLEYTLPNGEKLKFLNDNSICLGTQIELPDKGICCGVVADRELILICTYGENCADPKLLLYKKR